MDSSRGRIMSEMYHIQGRTELQATRESAMRKSSAKLNRADHKPCKVLVHMHALGEPCVEACETYFDGAQV